MGRGFAFLFGFMQKAILTLMRQNTFIWQFLISRFGLEVAHIENTLSVSCNFNYFNRFLIFFLTFKYLLYETKIIYNRFGVCCFFCY
jgi:hypothetical protein